MERLEQLVVKFREDYPDADAAMLLEFAQHVRRVLVDELREESKAGDAQVHVSMQLHGKAFSAKGPRSYVDSLMREWAGIASAPPMKTITPGFNRIKLLSGPTR